MKNVFDRLFSKILVSAVKTVKTISNDFKRLKTFKEEKKSLKLKNVVKTYEKRFLTFFLQ